MQGRNYSSLLAQVQGVYYFLTGLWPILHRPSFEQVTGPKYDFWLVITVGALISVIGAALVLAGYRREVTPQTALLAVGSAASLAGSDIIYSTSGRIRRVYLVESLAETGIIVLWLLSFASGQGKRI